MTQHVSSTSSSDDRLQEGQKEEEIDRLLVEAQELAFRLSEQEKPIHETWEQLCEIIESCRLGELTRHPKLELLYTERFNPLVKETYGSVTNYLRTLLDFTTPLTTGREEEEGSPWKWREEGCEERVRKNDWKYSIPNEIEHYVVWVNRPLFHKDLCTTSSSDDDETLTPLSTETKINKAADEEGRELDRNSWEFVKDYGLSGISTESNRSIRIKLSENKSCRGDKDDDDDEVGSTCCWRDPRKYVREFVENEWPVEKGWECAWFANPPSLQSVRGLAHFHVMVRRRPGWDGGDDGVEKEETSGKRP